ncbi:MAG: chromosomal replication initiator protein DnaA [Desulfobulbaceae bacterium A2]|nr:MAG: chromosomal replication initiator protein DnaA [Desulfobulbaceae bacterium A2]
MWWERLRDAVRSRISHEEFQLWIQPLSCLEEGEAILELTGPDRFFCAWMREKYLPLLVSQLQELDGGRHELRLLEPLQPLTLSGADSCQLRLPHLPAQGSTLRRLHPRYTFEEFLEGEGNVLASSACRALASGDMIYGPCLYLASSTGLGKSHLAQAVAHEVLREAPGTRLHYLTAQQFSNDMVRQIKANTLDQFKSRFQGCDFLLMEDVQCLSGKVRTQAEMDELLDSLIKTGTRVVLTGTVAPCVLDGLDSSFKSRMASGLVATIAEPDRATRQRIIRRKAVNCGLTLADDVVEFLAGRLRGDVRRLESAVIGLKAKAGVQGKSADLSLAREVIRELLGHAAEISALLIRDFVSGQFRISVEELKSRSRKRAVVFARHLGMYLSRKFTEETLADIGRLYERDHSTVLHGVQTITESIHQNASIRGQVELLSRRLNG